MPVDAERVQSIFAAVADAAPGDRPAILDRECGGDAEMRRYLEKLLAAHDDSAE